MRLGLRRVARVVSDDTRGTLAASGYDDLENEKSPAQTDREVCSRTMTSVMDELPSAIKAARAGASSLAPLDRELVALGVCASSAVLDREGMRRHAAAAVALGATAEQISEVLVTVSVIGMHTLTDGIPVVAEVLREAGAEEMTAGLDERRRELRERHVGEDPYWDAFEARLPGFLDGLLRLAPEAYALFFAYSALPWRSGQLSAVLKEQLYVAVDATPTHVYESGLALHATNARRLGSSPGDLADVLILAARDDEATLSRTASIVAGA